MFLYFLSVLLFTRGGWVGGNSPNARGTRAAQAATVHEGRTRHAVFTQSGLRKRQSQTARGHSPSSASQVYFLEPTETIHAARARAPWKYCSQDIWSNRM